MKSLGMIENHLSALWIYMGSEYWYIKHGFTGREAVLNSFGPHYHWCV